MAVGRCAGCRAPPIPFIEAAIWRKTGGPPQSKRASESERERGRDFGSDLLALGAGQANGRQSGMMVIIIIMMVMRPRGFGQKQLLPASWWLF